MVIMKHAFIALELNIFKKKLKNSLATKILQQLFIEYEQMNQQCVDNLILDLLILC